MCSEHIGKLVAGKKNIARNEYNIRGVATHISTDNRSWSNILGRALDHFPPPPQNTPSDIRLHFFLVDETFPTLDWVADSHLSYESESAKCFRCKETIAFYLEEKAMVVMDVSRPDGVVYLTKKAATSKKGFAHFLFYIVLQEMLKRYGLFHLHAACLARKERGLLLVGRSGSGKSTLALSLVKAGLDFLSDDVTLVRRTESAVTLLPLSQTITLTRDTLGLFPELKPTNRLGSAESRKVSIGMGEIYPQGLIASCRPSIIIFLTIGDGENFIKPIRHPEALATIICYSLILLDERTGRKHLDVLQQLVRTSQCFELNIRKDQGDVSQVAKRCLSLL